MANPRHRSPARPKVRGNPTGGGIKHVEGNILANRPSSSLQHAVARQTEREHRRTRGFGKFGARGFRSPRWGHHRSNRSLRLGFHYNRHYGNYYSSYVPRYYSYFSGHRRFYEGCYNYVSPYRRGIGFSYYNGHFGVGLSFQNYGYDYAYGYDRSYNYGYQSPVTWSSYYYGGWGFRPYYHHSYYSWPYYRYNVFADYLPLWDDPWLQGEEIPYYDYGYDYADYAGDYVDDYATDYWLTDVDLCIGW